MATLEDLQRQYDNYMVHYQDRYSGSGPVFSDIAAKDAILKKINDLKNQQAEQQQQQQFDTRLSDLMNRADPFASQRGQYQTQLSSLMNNPSAALETNPFFKASNEQGMEAANRKLQQIGMGTSGNAALELQKASQANMSGDYFRMADLLGGFAGAKADPSAGAQAGLGMLKLGEDARQFDQGMHRNQMGMTHSQVAQRPGSKVSAYWGGQ